ncbi:ABC transporter ATP-binding protein [Humibacillus sp. DSM 29435]|uniref:ABC transporter ATP-binding protein n=1 Tax=Humibacillus sp. DSM 29435 TaxID=1869167 RepID=UPI0008734699|nr:ATP-binding cassette domain-containing protein [Humibacillus sp. DSM 29435]OFE15541.1 ABC transporter ATP-binding protein [Humibacillus sp. DSM 29435]
MASGDVEQDRVIEVDGFTMTFGRTTVIEHLSFDVMRGETFGFIGSNGSGKTTTIRALLGIYQPTGGTLLVNGHVFTPQQGSTLGYLPEERGLYKKEKVLDVMVYFGRLKGLTPKEAKTWSMDYLERVDLTDKAGTRVDKLSGGQQQKIQLGVTIMNTPDLLILDEPTKGFDPVNRRLLMGIIEDQKKAGATVLMVTHQMEEVERLCDRVIMLKDGRAEAYGTISEIQDRFGGRTVRLRYAGQLPATSLDWEATLVDRNYAELSLNNDADEAAVLRDLVEAGIAVSSFTTTKKSMDEIFVTIYGDHDEPSETAQAVAN